MASKQQIIGIGAVALFGILAAGGAYLLWDAWSTRGDAETELAEEQETFASLNAAKVFPSKKSIASVQSNTASFVEWRTAAFALASRGDKSLPAESSAVFKQRLGAEVQGLVQLPGGVSGKLAAETFLFGFEQYLGESGVLPPQQDVPRLAVQLDTISAVARLFSEAGVTEVKGVTRVEKPAAAEDDESARKGAKKKGGKAAKADEADKTSSNTYKLSFTAHPEALVKVLNAFAAATRFAVVTSFSFAAAQENMVDRVLDARLAAKEGAAAGAAGGRRGRRGRRAVVEEEEKQGEEKKDDRLVVDPALDTPLAVELTLVVYDFGHPAAVAAEAPAKEAK